MNTTRDGVGKRLKERQKKGVRYKMIFKVKVFILFFLFFTVYGSQAVQTRHPYFWKVQKDGKTSYLLGTMHKPTSVDELVCSKEIRHRLESSDLVFVEINHLSPESREVVDTQKQWMLSKHGREFWALGRKSQEFLKSKGVNERLNLYGYTLVLDNLCNYGVDDTSGLRLDERITNIAYSKEIPVQDLDDFNEKKDRVMSEHVKKVDDLNQLSSEEFWIAIRSIDQHITQFDQQCPPQQLVNIIDLYKIGMGGFHFLNTVDVLSVLEKEHFFLEIKRRNSRWLNRFEEAHKNYDRIFLAGGLAHFMNPTGEGAVFINPVSFTGMLKDRGLYC